MEYTYTIAVALIIFASPFIVFAWLYGWSKVKRLKEREWPTKRKGLQAAVSRWESMTPEQRMEVETPKRPENATWLDSPTPEQEIRDMNERVYKEGLVHPLPQTKTQTAKEGESE